jgi:sucrose-6-phosphate hydrolase SacC (GH32 family)
MINTPNGWPGDGPVMVAWLSSWQTARLFPWPQGAGGPISLPRRLELRGNQLQHTIEPAIISRFHQPAEEVPEAGCGVARITGNAPFTLSIKASRHHLAINGDPATGLIELRRSSDLDDGLDYRGRHNEVLTCCDARTIRLFVDGPAIELFIEPDGRAASVALPSAGAFDVELVVDNAIVPIRWTTLA